MNYLITADLHLRDDCPSCRADDDWWATQTHDLTFVAEQANKHNAHLVIAGDVFHRPQVSEKLLLHTYNILSCVNKGVSMIVGNHDTPNHMLERMDESSYGVLAELLHQSQGYKAHLDNGDHSTEYDTVAGFNWGYFPKVWDHEAKIALTHLTIMSELKIDEAKTIDPKDVFKWLPQVEIIVAGDIHRTQHYLSGKGKNQRLLLVPGCLNCQAADFDDYNPMVHLLKDGELEPIYIPQDLVKFIEKADLKPKAKNTLAENIGKMGEQSVLSLFYEALKSAKLTPAQKEFVNKVHKELTGDLLWT